MIKDFPMPKVFISHSSEDNEVARKLAEYLRKDSAEVWIDYARIEGGESLPEVISNTDKVLFEIEVMLHQDVPKQKLLVN
jgi:predicted nucleotide-binding protein